MQAFNRRGQSLVEVALVMPVFAFVVWALAQLMFVCLNLVQHQRMAQVTADQYTLGSSPSITPYTRRYVKFGAVSPALRLAPHLIPTPEQRPYPGMFTVKTAGLLVHVEVKSIASPGWFMGLRLPWVNQQRSAETWLEPPAPQES